MTHELHVSVVVPTFNRAHLIAETLDSIRAQTLPPDEIIVVDDGSTDGTGPVMQRYAGMVRYIPIASSGVQVARNTGMQATTSPWIALCDSDDLWEPNYLERAAALIGRVPSLEMVFANTRQFAGERIAERTKFDEAPPGFWQSIAADTYTEGLHFRTSLAPFSFFAFHPIYPSAMLFRRTLCDRIGGFDPRLRGIRSEDGEFAVRCLYRSEVGALRDPLVRMRRHEGNRTGDKALTARGEAQVMQFVLATHADAQPYRDRLKAQVEERNARAFDAAFASLYLDLAREIWRDLPGRRRSVSRWAKFLVACLPAPAGPALCRLSQRLSEGLHARRATA